MSGSDLEALTDSREWSKGPLRCPEVVGRLYGMSESGLEAVQDV